MSQSHDAAYRLLFRHRRMVQDLLGGFVPGRWTRHLHPDSLERIGERRLNSTLVRREQDLVWRLTWGNLRLPVYLLLEIQSHNQSAMAVRFLSYTGLLYEELLHHRREKRHRHLPAMLPIVVYNGRRPWRAPRRLREMIPGAIDGLEDFQPYLEYLLIDGQRISVAELARQGNLVALLLEVEQSRTLAEVETTIGRLIRRLRKEPDDDLQKAFAAWLRQSLLPGRFPGARIQSLENLEEVTPMLRETVKEWTHQWWTEGHDVGLLKGRREGHQEGRQEGLQAGEAALLFRLLQRKFGSTAARYQRRLQAASTQELLVWGERVLGAERIEDVFATP